MTCKNGVTYLVGGGNELVTGNVGDLIGDSNVKAPLGVQSLTKSAVVIERAGHLERGLVAHSSNSRSSLSEHRKVLQSVLDPDNTPLDLCDVPRKLLSKSERGSILQMCSTNLDDMLECCSFLFKSISELLKSRDEGFVDLANGGDVHSRREAKQEVSLRPHHSDVIANQKPKWET